MLTVSDLTGKVVWEKGLDNTGGQLVWKNRALPGGVYFYLLRSHTGHFQSGKLIIQK